MNCRGGFLGRKMNASGRGNDTSQGRKQSNGACDDGAFSVDTYFSLKDTPDISVLPDLQLILLIKTRRLFCCFFLLL